VAFAVVTLTGMLTGPFLDLADGGEPFIAPVAGRATRPSTEVSMVAAAVARQAKLRPRSSVPTLTLMAERIVSLEGQSVHFTATWSQPVSRASYLFEWGDGQSSRSDEPNASHSYADPGLYSVSVVAKAIVDDKVTPIRSKELMIFVRVDPRNLPTLSLSANPPHPHAGEAVTFTATIDQSASPARYRYDSPKYYFYFGDGTGEPSKSDRITHFYVRPGVYHVYAGAQDSDHICDPMLSAPIELRIEPRGLISRLTVSLNAQQPKAGLWVAGMLVMIVGAVSWHLKRRGR